MPQPRHAPNVVVIGGGVASFAAAIRLRKLLPEARVRLLTNARPETLGGHLASWDEKGFAVEHGFHALFGFYEEAKKLLRETGAMTNFRRSPMHVHVQRGGKVHRLDLLNQVAYGGFTMRERVGMARFQLSAWAVAAQAMLEGEETFERYDSMDLREWARLAGMPESVIGSTYFEQFYAAAFNDPHELSALVGLQSLYGCGMRPWHYYFLKPSKEALILPLMEHFVRRCGGEVAFDHELLALIPDPERPERVARAVVNVGGRREEISADYFVLALGVEDFKRVDLGERWSHQSYFEDIQALESVVSLSLQAWFRYDPVPPHVDTFISGMPRPFSVVCPLSRVRRRPAHPDYPHELIACGSEAEFDRWSDEALVDKFVADLRAAGFGLRGDLKHGKDAWFVLRRNDAPGHRYLLTRPGQWHLRPRPKSPIANVMLAGAWTRSKWALPCVETAVRSAQEAAALVAEDVQARASADVLALRGAYRLDTVVLPPPYRFPDSTAHCFLLERAASASETATLPVGLERLPALARSILLAVFEHRGVVSDRDPTGSEYDYREVMLAEFVDGPRGPGIFPLALYLDDATAVAAGREVYGFPKKMAAVTVGEDGFSVVRPGRLAGTAGTRLEDVTLLAGEWRPASSVDATITDRVIAAIPSLPSLAIYNHLRVFEPDASGDVAYASLTCARMMGFHVSRARAVKDVRLHVGGSLHDPIDRLIAHEGGVVRPDRAVRLDFRFVLGAPADRKSTSAPPASEDRARVA